MASRRRSPLNRLHICIDKCTLMIYSDGMEKSVAGFDWDDGNVGKCQKHGVSIEVIEGLFRTGELRVEPDIGEFSR